MTNAQLLSEDLKNIDNDAIAISVAKYIKCPNNDDCTCDGKDDSPCTDCKIRWLRSDSSL